MKLLSKAIKIASVILGLTAPMTSAFADQGNLQPWQLPELTAEWWQWTSSIPTSVNPVTDATGDYCMVGQRGSIWFLAGNFTGAPAVTRNCSIPEGATLFFPVINVVTYNSPNVCGQGPKNLTAKEQQASIKPYIDAAQNLSVKVDGKEVSRALLRRVQAPPFELALPADNIFVASCSPLTPPGQPAGVYSPAVADGYYVSLPPLPPLPPGKTHTIHIQGQSDSFITVDVTYNLTVVPVLLK